MNKIVVAALYKFASLDDFKEIRQPLLSFMQNNDIKGTLLLAAEGINGTVSGSRESIDALLGYLKSDPRLKDLDHKESYCQSQPFYRTKVKLKKEIVTLGVPSVDPNKEVGQYLEPEEWNQLLSQPDVVVVDTRNDYEVDIGTFKNALNPNTTNFREFPEYVANKMQDMKDKKIAMFCTGGIRCEKATAFMLQQGFKEVFHLKGGILKYLEETPKEDSLWEGDCFVFDNRVAVNSNLEPSEYDQCHGCRHPISKEDRLSDKYKPGVHCPHCIDKLSSQQLERFEQRHKQVQLAKSRGEQHIGS